MKTMKYLSMLLVMVVTSVCMVSCGDDDDIPTDIATTIAGDYSGKLSVIGYTEHLHLKSVILDIMQNGNSYELSSSSKAVNGTVIDQNINLTFATGSNTYTFYGSK